LEHRRERAARPAPLGPEVDHHRHFSRALEHRCRKRVCRRIHISLYILSRSAMPRTLTFLHTTPAHIPTFDGLLAELDGDVPVRHIVHESLLREARAQGITPRLEERVGTSVRHAFDQGATVVACTCSTIAGS